jgi:hypothetical protein
VTREDVPRLEAAQRAARRRQTKHRVQREPLAADAQLRNRPDGIGADQNPLLRPPERDLLPAAALTDVEALERCAVDRSAGDDVVRNPEALGESAAVTVVTVEQLDHSGGLPHSAKAVVDAVRFERIDEPDAPVGDHGVGAPLEKFLDDPSERVRRSLLVAEANPHARKIYTRLRTMQPARIIAAVAEELTRHAC